MNLRKTIFVVCLAVAAAACNRTPPLTDSEKNIVNELTGNLKTRCVGRYLIDMPVDAPEYGDAKVQGVIVQADPLSLDDYHAKVAKRETELRAIKSVDAYPFLYESGEARGKNTWYFVHRDIPHNDPATRVIEAYKWESGFVFELRIETFDYEHPDRTDDPIVKQFDVKNRLPQQKELVFGTLDKIRARPSDEIPKESGFCFSGGFLANKNWRDDDVYTHYALNDRTGVGFTLMTNGNTYEEATLLERGLEAQMLFHGEAGKVIRKGSVDLAGMKAEEWLTETVSDAGVPEQRFSLELNPTRSGTNAPFLSLDMINGAPRRGGDAELQHAPLTRGEALALWDAVSRTLRLRPGAL
ncbi:T6SS immunity protein Tli4 family protein [Caballeronia ptereochthonis]|uniref:Lipoprotein n=1 Tax=Caballeronia ptereochthonis TaxID=1777144 RepID=A0A158D6I4_9BURK|nr:T6SS immunity protein Tli4 family protein [Caballeronia ptereochthonis]SAK89950.1 putative lipoprotein [Caballeronia ptereochthonis]